VPVVLEALLPSAGNMAWILAQWDAGSQAAFVARMNATARRPGMRARRVWISVTGKTCRRVRDTAPACGKLQDRIPGAWEVRNWRRVGDVWRGGP
jgi:hypothetical protein